MKLSTSEQEKFKKLSKDLLNNNDVLKMQDFIQHGKVTTYAHCVDVAKMALHLNNILKMNADEKTLVEALESENIFRKLAHVINTASGDRKIPVVASKGNASWVDEEGTISDSDDAFTQVSIGAYKLGTLIKVSNELLHDSVFDLEKYISKEFARRIGTKEEDSFFNGDGDGKPVGMKDEKTFLALQDASYSDFFTFTDKK